jgi:hypothetical protein
MDPDALLQLRNLRFPQLPLDCGSPDPGITDVDEWRDWTEMPTTPDQLRIEDYLDRFDLRGKSILHVGAGNSGLAVRFARRAREIVGTTVVASEAAHGRDLGLRNYRVLLHNKYSAESEGVSGPFDFIVDNNPTTFCCCIRHFGAVLDFYASNLAPNGQLVTDRVGLGWTTDAPGSNPRWRFSFDDLAQAAPLAGLTAYRISGDTYILAREAPPRPPLRTEFGHFLRSLFGKAKRKLRRLARSILR